jgi:hypothetical protein
VDERPSGGDHGRDSLPNLPNAPVRPFVVFGGIQGFDGRAQRVKILLILLKLRARMDERGQCRFEDELPVWLAHLAPLLTVGTKHEEQETYTRVDGFPVLSAWGSTASAAGGSSNVATNARKHLREQTTNQQALSSIRNQLFGMSES